MSKKMLIGLTRLGAIRALIQYEPQMTLAEVNGWAAYIIANCPL